MDIHHVISMRNAKKLIENYNAGTDVAIALPSREHYVISKFRNRTYDGLNKLIEGEVVSIFCYTDVPMETIKIIRSEILKHNKK